MGKEESVEHMGVWDGLVREVKLDSLIEIIIKLGLAVSSSDQDILLQRETGSLKRTLYP